MPEQQCRAEQQDTGAAGRGMGVLAGGRSWNASALSVVRDRLKKSGPALAAQLEESGLARMLSVSSSKTLKSLPTSSSSDTRALQDGAERARAHRDGRGQCARSRGPFPALSPRPFSSRFSSQLLGPVSGSFR